MDEFDQSGWNGTVVTELREVHPGHMWQYVEIEGAELILTSAFQALPLNERANLVNLLNVFINRAGSPRDYRMGRKIENGREGTVCTFGDDHVIKILSLNFIDDYGIDFPTRMLNMAILRDYAQTELPEWIDVVEDYLYFNNGRFNFTVMPRVGNGVTIYDLWNHLSVTGLGDTYISEFIRRDFPVFDSYQMERLLIQFGSLKTMLGPIKGRSYEELPTIQDFEKSNIIVEPLIEAIDGYSYKLWIIDQ